MAVEHADGDRGGPVTAESLQRYLDSERAFAGYGFRVAAVAEGSCTLAVPFRPELERPGGIVSGQVFMTAADVAMWFAIKTLRGMDDPSVTSHMQTQFLRPAKREPFVCTAKVLRIGGRTAFGTAECVAEDGRLLAHSTLAYAAP